MKRPFPRLKVLLGIGGCALALSIWSFDSIGNAPQVPDAPTIPSANVTATDVPPSPAPGEPAPVPAATPSTAPANLSPALAEVGRLAESGVSEDVILAYIATADFRTAPTVDEILYLNDLGLSDAVITAILNRVKELQAAGAIAAAPPLETNATPLASSPVNYGEPEPVPATEVVQPAPTQEVNVTYFYDSLEPYGSWVNVGGYGMCWRPTVVVVNPRWRPYCDRGRWVYTDCGWYWQSDYSWGWAAFHYGRWHQSPSFGWVWVPGSTWGPSWVSWRYSSEYCGWAPLPPEARYDGVSFYYRSARVGFHFDFGLREHHYTFVPTRRICDRDITRHYVAPSHATTIYNHTTVNNYYVQQNNTVINRGIAAETVVRATSRPLTPVAIRDVPRAHPRKVDVVDRNSNTLLVHRPNLAPPAGHSKTPTTSPRHIDHARVKPAGNANSAAATPVTASNSHLPPGHAKHIEPVGRNNVPVTSPRDIEHVKPTVSIQPEKTQPSTRPETKQPHVPPGQAKKQPPIVTAEKEKHTSPAASPFAPRIVSPSSPTVPATTPTPVKAPPVFSAPARDISKPHPSENRPDKGHELTAPSTIPGKVQGHDKRIFTPENNSKPQPTAQPNRHVFTPPAQAQPAKPAAPIASPAVPQTTPKVQPHTPKIHQDNSAKKVEVPRPSAPIQRVEQRPQPSSPSWNVNANAQTRSFSSRAVQPTPAPSISAPAPSPRPTPSPSFQSSPAPVVRQHVPSHSPAVVARPVVQAPVAQPSVRHTPAQATPSFRPPAVAQAPVQIQAPQPRPSHAAQPSWNAKPAGPAGGPPGHAKKEKK